MDSDGSYSGPLGQGHQGRHIGPRILILQRDRATIADIGG